MFWPKAKVSLLRLELATAALEVHALSQTEEIAVVQARDTRERNVTSEAVWVLAICAVIDQATSKAPEFSARAGAVDISSPLC
jgi:hypothetical protein